MTAISNSAWVRGLIPGQPQWVIDAVSEEFDRYDDRMTVLKDRLHQSMVHLSNLGYSPSTDGCPVEKFMHEVESILKG